MFAWSCQRSLSLVLGSQPLLDSLSSLFSGTRAQPPDNHHRCATDYEIFYTYIYNSNSITNNTEKIITALSIMPNSDNPKNLADDNSDATSLGSVQDDESKYDKEDSKPNSVNPVKKKLSKKKETSLLDLLNNSKNATQQKRDPKFVLNDAIVFESDTMSYAPVKDYL